MMNVVEDALIAVLDWMKDPVSRGASGLDREIFGSYASIYLQTKNEDLREESGNLLRTFLTQGHDPQIILNKTKSAALKADLGLRARSLDLLEMMMDLHADGRISLSAKQKGIVARRVQDIMKTAERTQDSDIVLSRVVGTRHLRRYVFG